MDLTRRGHASLITRKKRVRDRDEGYDVEDPFVDDTDLAINEPKTQARPKMEGYVAVVGEVETYEDDKCVQIRYRILSAMHIHKLKLKMACLPFQRTEEERRRSQTRFSQ